MSLPLFKKELPGKSPYIELEDYEEIGLAYTKMLQKLMEAVPNIDSVKSVFCGFSNGGHSIADILIKQEHFFMKNFQTFVLVEGGTPFAKQPEVFVTSGFKKNRILSLIGEHPELQGQLDKFTTLLKIAGSNITILSMPGVGRAFPENHYATVRGWVRGAELDQP